MFLRQLLHVRSVVVTQFHLLTAQSTMLPHITDVWISPAEFWLVLCYTWLVCFCVIFSSYIILYNIEHTNILNAHGSISLQPSTKTCLLQLVSLSLRLFLLSLCPRWFCSVDGGSGPGAPLCSLTIVRMFPHPAAFERDERAFSLPPHKVVFLLEDDARPPLHFYFYPYVFSQNTEIKVQKPKSQILMFGTISCCRGAESTFYSYYWINTQLFKGTVHLTSKPQSSPSSMLMKVRLSFVVH